MNIWDPFHPLAYFLHASLGGIGILCAVLALAMPKGSKRHIIAGRTFASAAAVAALTALTFSFANFAPMAIASAAMLLSVVISAILAQRNKNRRLAAGESMAALLMAFVLVWLLYGVVVSVPLGGFLWLPPFVLATVAAVLLAKDIQYIRLAEAERESIRLTRHLSRMALAVAIAIHEPVVVFSDDLHLHPSLAFYGPLLIWPAIFYFFRARLGGNASMVAGN